MPSRPAQCLGLCKTAGLKLVYSPLNGSGLVPVTHVLNDGASPIRPSRPSRSVPLNGYFTTCPPEPRNFRGLKLGLELATKTGADLMLANWTPSATAWALPKAWIVP